MRWRITWRVHRGRVPAPTGDRGGCTVRRLWSSYTNDPCRDALRLANRVRPWS
jgi:hypothetical protein